MTHPDLTGLLRGELTTREASEASHHLRTCEECVDELADLVLGHALLSATVRTVGRDALGPAGEGEPLPPLPRTTRLRPAGRRGRRTSLVLAAAAVVVAAAGTVVGVRVLDRDTPGADTAGPSDRVASAPLRSLPGAGPQTGEVALQQEDDGRMLVTITTHDLPAPATGDFYYAWLLDPETQKMLPLGQVPSGRSASFDVPASIVRGYAAVDVSLEDDDGDPGHSVTSVLRGTRPDPPPLDS